MNTSTTTMNNVNKVQVTTANGKPNAVKKESEPNFNDLFSSALGQTAPKAQLNSIESQLRESLFKQDKPKKNTDSNANAEAAQTAVWAQRNWMQTAPAPQISAAALDSKTPDRAPQATQSTPINNAEPPKQATTAENTTTPANVDQAKARENAPEKIAKPAADQASAQGAQAEPASNNTTPVRTDASAPSAPNVAAMATDTSAGNNPAFATAFATASATATTGERPSTLPAELSSAEQTTQTATDSARPAMKTTTQLKADATLNNSTVSVRNDQVPASAANNASNLSNASAVAAQLAPQMAQQVQASGEGFGEEGIKVGQKILAAGNLQSSGTPNGIAAGSNGLTGSTGSAQPSLIKTPVNQPGFAKELGQTVQWAIGKNLSTVDIRVNPETFGPMNMRLVQKGQQVQLVIRTQDEASANLLTQALSGLKEVLAQNGLQLSQVQIQHGNTPTPQGQASNGQSQPEQGNNGQGQRGQQSASGNNSQQEAPAAPSTPHGNKPQGTLDLFA